MKAELCRIGRITPLKKGKQLSGGITRIDLADYIRYGAVVVAYKSCADNAHVFSSGELFQLPHTGRFAQRMFRVGNKREGQLILGYEALMALLIACAHTDYLIAHFQKLRVGGSQ